MVPEPLGGAHTNPDKMAEVLRDYLLKHLEDLLKLSPQQRLESATRNSALTVISKKARALPRAGSKTRTSPEMSGSAREAVFESSGACSTR
jgi:hypothetical protein